MKTDTIFDSSFALAGFTSGNCGIWTRNTPDDPPSEDYNSLSKSLGVSLERMVRPYQANGQKAAIAGLSHGGMGITRDNDLKKTDALVTDCKGFVLSIIAADCVPVYLMDERAEVIALMHCGRQSVVGSLLHNTLELMKKLGAETENICMIIGHHICVDCYEVGEEIRSEFESEFSTDELEKIFSLRDKRLYLGLSAALRIKASREGISADKISRTGVCTCCGDGFYSCRRGDKQQNLAYFMMK